MDCLAGICGERAQPLTFDKDPRTDAFEAACKLSANFARVAFDCTNQGPTNIDGKNLTQAQYKRVSPESQPVVRAMLTAVCSRLLDKEALQPSKEDAKVWMVAARFVSNRLQDSAKACPGRNADMTPGQAEQMRQALGQIEAASKLIYNFDTVVKDITNSRSVGVYGEELTQPELKRIDPKNKALVEAMLKEVCNRLFGKAAVDPRSLDDMKVWAAAAGFFAQRVQCPDSECPTDRVPDMTVHAGRQLRQVCVRMEAACKLSSNMASVSTDITNANPKTQTELQRIDVKNQTAVDNMLKAVVALLLNQSVPMPSTQSEAAVWKDAAVYLHRRIQSKGEDCPGRAPDMSPLAAAMMRRILGQIEAHAKLYSNLEKVVEDITNPNPKTQLNLKRVDRTNQKSVDIMVREVCSRLLGTRTNEPESVTQTQVWADAAEYLHGRIQSSVAQCPGRDPDMSREAATEMRKVLAQITSTKVNAELVMKK